MITFYSASSLLTSRYLEAKKLERLDDQRLYTNIPKFWGVEERGLSVYCVFSFKVV